MRTPDDGPQRFRALNIIVINSLNSRNLFLGYLEPRCLTVSGAVLEIIDVFIFMGIFQHSSGESEKSYEKSPF
jgi:hypothetical protein